MTLDLRPLTLGELFDRAFTLYKRNLWLFVGIMAFPSLVALVMTIAAQVFQRMLINIDKAGDPSMGAVVSMLTMMVGVFALMAVYWVVNMIALGATTYAVAEIYVGRLTSVRDAYAGIKGRIGTLLLLMLLIGIRFFGIFLLAGVVMAIGVAAGAFIHPVVSGLAAVFGMLAMVAVAVFFMLRWALSVPALVIENLSAGASISRSIDLAHGRLGRLFLLGLCAMVVTYAAMAIFQGPFTVGALIVGPDTLLAFWLNIAGAVTGTVASAFTTPFAIIGLALLYYDARIREEAFDVELALQALEARDKPASVPQI